MTLPLGKVRSNWKWKVKLELNFKFAQHKANKNCIMQQKVLMKCCTFSYQSCINSWQVRSLNLSACDHKALTTPITNRNNYLQYSLLFLQISLKSYIQFQITNLVNPTSFKPDQVKLLTDDWFNSSLINIEFSKFWFN